MVNMAWSEENRLLAITHTTNEMNLWSLLGLLTNFSVNTEQGAETIYFILRPYCCFESCLAVSA